MRNLPSFSSLRAFEAAARLGSFKEAALALNLSTSAVSHQIRSLEKMLGEKMFERKPGGVELTETAERYLKVVRASLDQLEKGTAAIQGHQEKHQLRITLLSSLSTLWLIPALESFRRQQPGIDIELIDDAELVDFNSAQVDAAIRYDFAGKGQWRNLVAHPLLEEHVFPVCSPKYLEMHPEIVELDWNASHTLLVNSRHKDEWDRWAETAGSPLRLKAHPALTVMDTSNMTLMAARSGLGIALGRTPFMDQMLARAELVRIHSQVQHRGIRLYLVYPAEFGNRRHLMLFRDWLVTTGREAERGYLGYSR